ncbi:MAG: A24 family peptidase [Muribaculaceae bacterium]|nr:A24 family peptidase [Muribaculaceae bacterium]
MISNIFFTILLAAAIFCAWRISMADFRRRIIPDAYLLPLAIIGLILVAWFPWPFGPRIAAMGAAFGYILATIIGFAFEKITNRHHSDTIPPIGFGDIKLISVGGIWLGTTGLSIALIISCITGILWARHQNQRYIPFAPFFLIGGFLALIAISFLI